MNFTWMLNRLRSMSAREILWRVEEQRRRKTIRGRLDRWDAYVAEGNAVPVLPGLINSLDDAPPALAAAVGSAAGRIIDGKFSALGVDWPVMNFSAAFPHDVWTLDPVTGRHWPGAEQLCFDIGYRHAKDFGDIKYCWEFNRLQFLQPVAAAIALDGGVQAVAFIEATVASWFDHNPPYRGIAWNSGIEIALRAISLLIVTSLCGEKLSGEAIRRIRLILAASLAWLNRFPSRFSSANNHLVAECAAEFLITTAVPAFPRAAVINTHARRILEREAGLQFLDDGVGAEQSPTYGAFSAEFMLLSALVARVVGAPLDRRVEDALIRFATFIGWISTAGAKVPTIGDDDEGKVITLAVHETTYAASISAAIAGVTGAGPFGPAPVTPELRDAIFGIDKHGAPAPSGTRSFATGGYAVHRGPIGGRDALVVFDHGPLGYLSIAAHGHSDALALQLFLDGDPVLVDPGTYLYHSGGLWRDWFRGTRAHNTLTIGGRNQSTISGSFNWSSKACATLLEQRGGAEPLFRASHDGYRREFGIIHERTVTIGEQGIDIRDRLLGQNSNSTPVEMTFQLASGLDVLVAGERAWISRDGRPLAEIAFPELGKVSVVLAGGPLEGGWISPHFGGKIPAPRIVWKAHVAPVELLTHIAIA